MEETAPQEKKRPPDHQGDYNDWLILTRHLPLGGDRCLEALTKLSHAFTGTIKPGMPLTLVLILSLLKPKAHVYAPKMDFSACFASSLAGNG
jgi:hypothetical protein